ncbi:hypothetical protein HanIR_Chr07g0318311 [Helianthus annuus]|nr:hypothetical protein HanIR_Chr07g0318311 [Helianthus annuus]
MLELDHKLTLGVTILFHLKHSTNNNHSPLLPHLRLPTPSTISPSSSSCSSIFHTYKGARGSTNKLGALESSRTALVFFYPPLFYT